jgi:hypothetical protein
MLMVAPASSVRNGRVVTVRQIHETMTARVVRAPYPWFEKTPIGKVLARFSRSEEDAALVVVRSLFIKCGSKGPLP